MTAPNPDWVDPELADMFRDDPGLAETARLLRAARPEPVMDVHFQRRLRGFLMQEAEARPVRAGRRRPAQHREPRAPFWMRLRATHLAWGGVGVGVALTAATVIALVTGGQGQDRQRTVIATSTVAAQHLVSPTNAITVSFNQPMNHSAVESGLRIEPATQVTTAWSGNDLVITPVHHLAGNTPYTVTIAQPALIASSGARATAALQITFGTAPTPPVTPGTPAPPALTTSNLGAAEAGGLLLFAPDGSVVVDAPAPPTGSGASGGASAVTASPSPTPSPSSSATASPAATLPAVPTLAPTPTPKTSGPVMEELNQSSGTPLVLGPAATAAAFSPDGASLASIVPSPSGGSDIVLSRSDGTNRRTLTHSAVPVVAVAWTSSSLEFATADAVKTVDASGTVAQVVNPQGSIAALSPDGAHGYLTPGGGGSGRLFSIADGSSHTLSGAGGITGVAFSGDGSTVAWLDNSSGHPSLLTEPVAVKGSSAVSILDPGAELGTIALNRDGSRVAYTETTPDGTGKLVIAQVPTGAPVATGAAGSAIAFSPQGDAVALLASASQGAEVELAQLPGAAATSSLAVPAGATQTLHAFLDAQARGDHSALSVLGIPGVVSGALLPPGQWRSSLVDAVTQPDGTVQAIATLVLDPTLTRLTTLVADETLTVEQSGASYVVSSLNLSPLHPLAAGPHVLNVTSSQQQGRLTVLVAFDSDLAPDTVPGAIALQEPSGTNVPATVSYDVNTRTATVTVTRPPAGALSVVVATAIRDINDGSPPATFSAPVVGG